MNKHVQIMAIALSMAITTPIIAQSSTKTCHKTKQQSAPATIMGDHNHKKNHYMTSYQYKYSEMSDLLSGTNQTSKNYLVTQVSNIFSGEPMQPNLIRVSPDKMTMSMHMFGAMYGLTDNLTLNTMIPWIEKEMTTTTYSGASGVNILGKSNMKSSGWGDIKFGAIYKLYQNDKHYLNIKNSLSIPTGSIKKEANMLSYMGNIMRMRLGYGMQIGSGTYNYHPSITYTYQNNKWKIGTQYKGAFHIGKNNAGYRLGNTNQLNIWISKNIEKGITGSINISAKHIGNIKGIDSNIISPSLMADTNNYGRTDADISFGINFKPQTGILKGNSFSSEINMPIYQNVNGYQMRRDNSITLNWKKAF